MTDFVMPLTHKDCQNVSENVIREQLGLGQAIISLMPPRIRLGVVQCRPTPHNSRDHDHGRNCILMAAKVKQTKLNKHAYW
jgi:hypothetical protein